MWESMSQLFCGMSLILGLGKDTEAIRGTWCWSAPFLAMFTLLIWLRWRLQGFSSESSCLPLWNDWWSWREIVWDGVTIPSLLGPLPTSFHIHWWFLPKTMITVFVARRFSNSVILSKSLGFRVLCHAEIDGRGTHPAPCGSLHYPGCVGCL